MSRPRSTNRTKAQKMWIKSGRTMLLKDIASELGVSDVQIRRWKWEDNWEEIPENRPRGGQPGNKNAVGNVGGPGGPLGNDKAVKHHLYSNFLPDHPEFQKLMELVQQMEPLDMLWQAVEMAFAKMMWAQRIMFVRDKQDETRVLKKEKHTSIGGNVEKDIEEFEWEYQHAWDKQSVDIKAYSVASREFRSAMKQFLSAAPENDERRAKLELMQVQAEKIKADIKANNPSGASGVKIVDDIPSGGKR